MSIQIYNNIGEKFSAQHETVSGQMFGKPCLKIGKKAFAAFFKEEMVFKLGEQEIKLLINKYPGSVNWDPSGKNRAMKDWLQVPNEFNTDWKSLAKLALDFVSGSN